MKDKVLEMLFKKASRAIKEKIGSDEFKEEYHAYISNVYGPYFDEIAWEDENDESIKELVDCYVKCELMCFERSMNYGKK